jgi:hypothetical protein
MRTESVSMGAGDRRQGVLAAVAFVAFAVVATACSETATQPRDGRAADTAADRPDASTSDASPGDGGNVDGGGGAPDSRAAADALDTLSMSDAPANDGLSGDAAETDRGSSDGGGGNGDGDGNGDGGGDGGDAGATCGPGVPRAMLCTTYCQGIGTLCTGGSAQYGSAERCAAICNAPTWACGNQGDTTGNSLFCRVAHLVLAGVGAPAMECGNAGPASLACR